MRCYALSQTSQEEASAVLCALQNLPPKLEGKPQISGYLCSRHSVRFSFVKHVLLDWQKQRDEKTCLADSRKDGQYIALVQAEVLPCQRPLLPHD